MGMTIAHFLKQPGVLVEWTWDLLNERTHNNAYNQASGIIRYLNFVTFKLQDNLKLI